MKKYPLLLMLSSMPLFAATPPLLDAIRGPCLDQATWEQGDDGSYHLEPQHMVASKSKKRWIVSCRIEAQLTIPRGYRIGEGRVRARINGFASQGLVSGRLKLTIGRAEARDFQYQKVAEDEQQAISIALEAQTPAAAGRCDREQSVPFGLLLQASVNGDLTLASDVVAELESLDLDPLPLEALACPNEN